MSWLKSRLSRSLWRVRSLAPIYRRVAPRGAGSGLRPAAALVLLALAVSAAPAASSGWTPEKTVRADLLVERFLARVDSSRESLPAASLALSIGSMGKLYEAKGYGEAAPGVPATAHTIYHVGSLAKQFTAVAVLDLIGRGAKLRDGTPLTLDLALARIFDGVEHWPGMEAGVGHQPVTLRSLLTMTSNLPNFTRRPPAATDPWGRIGAPALLSELKKLRPSGWPGTFEYSNTSYFLLAEAIEEAIAPGEPRPSAHHDYLRRIVFPRAGLIETGFVGEPMPGAVLARAIHRREPVFDQPDWLKGSADIASSALDIFSWNAAFMSGKVLTPELSALMVSDGARVTPEIYYGMGWFVEHRSGRDVFFHSGRVPGFTSMNVISAGTAAAGWTSVTLLVNTDVAEGLDTLADDLIRLARE